MFCIVGLGNMGETHKYSRHNAGFMALDQLALEFDLSFNNQFCGSDNCILETDNELVLLSKPRTGLNNSGEFIRQLLSKNPIPIDHIIVIYDDMSLPTGEIRIRSKGGPGTHNGIRSIITALNGQEDFPRIRLGIGRPVQGENPISHVLGTPSPDEMLLLWNAFTHASEAARLIVNGNLELAQNKFNVKGRNRTAKGIYRF